MKNGGVITWEDLKNLSNKEIKVNINVLSRARKGLKCCTVSPYLRHCSECPYNDYNQFINECQINLRNDLLELLNN